MRSVVILGLVGPVERPKWDGETYRGESVRLPRRCRSCVPPNPQVREPCDRRPGRPDLRLCARRRGHDGGERHRCCSGEVPLRARGLPRGACDRRDAPRRAGGLQRSACGRQLLASTRKELESVCELVKPDSFRLVTGSIAETLVAEAKLQSATLVVLGAARHRRLTARRLWRSRHAAAARGALLGARRAGRLGRPRTTPHPGRHRRLARSDRRRGSGTRTRRSLRVRADAGDRARRQADRERPTGGGARRCSARSPDRVRRARNRPRGQPRRPRLQRRGPAQRRVHPRRARGPLLRARRAALRPTAR